MSGDPPPVALSDRSAPALTSPRPDAHARQAALPTKPFPSLDDKLLKQATANFLLTDGMGVRPCTMFRTLVPLKFGVPLKIAGLKI
jgi:hypothetical protein